MTMVYHTSHTPSSFPCIHILHLYHNGTLDSLQGLHDITQNGVLKNISWITIRVPTLLGKHEKTGILSFTFPGLENAWNLLKNCEKSGILSQNLENLVFCKFCFSSFTFQDVIFKIIVIYVFVISALSI